MDQMWNISVHHFSSQDEYNYKEHTHQMGMFDFMFR